MARDTSTSSDLPSAWLMRFSPVIESGFKVLELACGNGRNTRFLASLGCQVTAVDINPMPEVPAGVDFLRYDLENSPWPFEKNSFDVVIGINYLWRRHFPQLRDSLKLNGLFLYETFNEEQSILMGRPKNPEHFLKIGELLTLVDPNWRILAFEDGVNEREQYLQRIAARKCLIKNMLLPNSIRLCVAR